MKLRYKILPLALTVIALCIAYILSHPLEFGFCQKIYTFGEDYRCLDKIIQNVGFPLRLFAERMLPLVIILLFVSKNAFTSWVKFALWWIPLSFLLIANAPDTGHQAFRVIEMNMLVMAKLTGWTFLILSLLLIAFKSLRKK